MTINEWQVSANLVNLPRKEKKIRLAQFHLITSERVLEQMNFLTVHRLYISVDALGQAGIDFLDTECIFRWDLFCVLSELYAPL